MVASKTATLVAFSGERVKMCLQTKAITRKVYRFRIKQYARDRVAEIKRAKFAKGNKLFFFLTIHNIYQTVNILLH